ncbi:MAG TPA: AMP-binding protein [Acidimicrobiales bacterium]
MNLASVIDRHPEGSVALVSHGRTTTYGELRDQVARLRSGLAGLGLQPGDRVALVAANNRTFVVAYLASLSLGAVAVPLNPLSPQPELQRELEVVGARVLVAGPVAARTVGTLDRAALGDLEHVLAPPGVDLPGVRSFHDLDGSGDVPVCDRTPDDLAALIFTSGTAGPPRAAMLTHGNLLANIDQMQTVQGNQTPDDVVLGVLPMFHIYGLNVVLGMSLAFGSRVVLVERFDPHSALETIGQQDVTVIAGVPTMWSAWASLPGPLPGDFGSVRLATSGAAPLDPVVRRTVRDRFDLNVTEGYGLTEASPAVTTGLGVDAPDGSIGVPLPGVELRLIDSASGDDALVGDPGELWVRGPNVFPGYWNDPEGTAAALTSEGWLRTGDVAVVDDQGYLYLVDRAKDLIIVSGFNVFPAEVEEVLVAHPGVAEAAVVGVPHPHSGEAVTAYVVPTDTGGELDEEDVIAFCAQRLARYKCPAKLVIVDELPHDPAGKILRRVLR